MKFRVTRDGAGQRIQLSLVLGVVGVLGITSVSAASSAMAHPSKASAKPTVKIAKTIVGPLLVNKSGYTVYMFMRDKHDKDECVKIKGCEKDWPAVTTTVKPVAGPGVKKSLLGTIPYEGTPHSKLLELTYKGHPLHTYRFDTSKGSVINIGNRQFKGAWYALNAKGAVVK